MKINNEKELDNSLTARLDLKKTLDELILENNPENGVFIASLQGQIRSMDEDIYQYMNENMNNQHE